MGRNNSTTVLPSRQWSFHDSSGDGGGASSVSRSSKYSYNSPTSTNAANHQAAVADNERNECSIAAARDNGASVIPSRQWSYRGGGCGGGASNVSSNSKY